jgi:hypothetical protein
VFNKDSVREPYTETFLKNAAGKSGGDEEDFLVAGNPQCSRERSTSRDVIKGIPALAGGAERWKELIIHTETVGVMR